MPFQARSGSGAARAPRSACYGAGPSGCARARVGAEARRRNPQGENARALHAFAWVRWGGSPPPRGLLSRRRRRCGRGGKPHRDNNLKANGPRLSAPSIARPSPSGRRCHCPQEETPHAWERGDDPHKAVKTPFLKRIFGLDRCTWRSWSSFQSYVWGSILSFNLLVLARHLLT